MGNVLARGRHITRSYAESTRTINALSDASFEIDGGDRIAIVGPSGSGKSTLLHIVAGIDHPSEGEIDWPALGGEADLRPSHIGFAFQGPSLLEPLSVLENVALPLLLCGVDEQEAMDSARVMLGRFELDASASKLPEELSGGQGQRAALARALITRPDLLLADEPTGQQDTSTAHRVMDVLLSVLDESGGALAIATHDESVAERITTRWSMADGHLSCA